MIKITFEFPTIDSAVAFLQKGKLPNTNEIVDVYTDILQPLMPEAMKDAMENIVDDAKPLSARERRLAKGKLGNFRVDSPGTDIKIKAEVKKRRNKRKKSQEKEAPVSDEITDADLAKAASNGAEEIGPKLVTEILEQFGVGNVSELKGDQRKEFIDLINKEVK